MSISQDDFELPIPPIDDISRDNIKTADQKQYAPSSDLHKGKQTHPQKPNSFYATKEGNYDKSDPRIRKCFIKLGPRVNTTDNMRGSDKAKVANPVYK